MDDEKELVLVMSKYLSLGNNCKQKSTLLQSDESMSCEETQESHSHRLSLHSASWRRQRRDYGLFYLEADMRIMDQTV